jgi:catechol 2,3-dioxygenase-like lactoylglutathione lyase family enzyme
MIGYVSFGTNDWKRGLAFYDALFAELGAKRIMDYERFVMWGQTEAGPGFALCTPFDKKSATVGNGAMVALKVDTPEKVRTLHAKALALGATDEGAPGNRGGNFYGAYFRDLDGNKLNFHCYT